MPCVFFIGPLEIIRYSQLSVYNSSILIELATEMRNVPRVSYCVYALIIAIPIIIELARGIIGQFPSIRLYLTD